MEQTDYLRKSFKTAIIIGGAIIASLIVYVFLVEIIKSQYKPFSRFITLENIKTIRYFIYGVGIALLLIIRILRGILLRKSPGDNTKSLIRKLLKTSILTSALCEGPAVLGFIFFLLTGFTRDFYMLLLVSLFLMFMFFPRYRSWEEWSKVNNKPGCSPPCL